MGNTLGKSFGRFRQIHFNHLVTVFLLGIFFTNKIKDVAIKTFGLINSILVHESLTNCFFINDKPLLPVVVTLAWGHLRGDKFYRSVGAGAKANEQHLDPTNPFGMVLSILRELKLEAYQESNN